MKIKPLTTSLKRLTAWGAASVGVFGFSLHTQAELLAYDGFDYERNPLFGADLVGNNLGGVGDGWAGSWMGTHNNTSSSNSQIVEGSLSYTDQHGNVLLTSGNHAQVSGQTVAEGGNNTNVGRELAEHFDMTPGKVYYISFLGQRQGEPADPADPVYEGEYPWGDNLYPRGANMRTLSNIGSNSSSSGTGAPSNRDVNVWAFQSERTLLDSDVPFTEQALVVLRVAYYDAGQDEDGGMIVGTHATLWVNPSNLAVENTEEAVAGDILDGEDAFAMSVQGIGFGGNNESGNRPASIIAVDEVRVGTSWAAVTPHEAGDTPAEPYLNEFPVTNGWADTAGWLGMLYVADAPWAYQEHLGWIWVAEDTYGTDTGAWIYVPKF